MESYEFTDCDKAIEMLQNMKKNGQNGKIVVFTINFDDNTECKKIATTDEGRVLVRKSKTIVINEDTFLPHMQLFSNTQTDIENIIKKGIMHDIILGGG